jgi:hypothetical protein
MPTTQSRIAPTDPSAYLVVESPDPDMARMRIPVMNGVGLSTVTYFIPFVNGIVDIAVTAVRGVESKEHVAD